VSEKYLSNNISHIFLLEKYFYNNIFHIFSDEKFIQTYLNIFFYQKQFFIERSFYNFNIWQINTKIYMYLFHKIIIKPNQR
jgi:hypothetical protein